MNVASHHTLDQLKTMYRTEMPELNPVENLWHYLRSHYWSNRTYADYDALRLAAIDAWQKAAPDPTIIQSVCPAPYAERIN